MSGKAISAKPGWTVPLGRLAPNVIGAALIGLGSAVASGTVSMPWSMPRARDRVLASGLTG
jgi:fluoride ion exporter CrcB/FEX